MKFFEIFFIVFLINYLAAELRGMNSFGDHFISKQSFGKLDRERSKRVLKSNKDIIYMENIPYQLC